MLAQVRRNQAIVVFASLLGCTVAPSVAFAGADEVCFGAALSGQKLEKAGNLMDAAAQFRVCAREACPTEVSSTCTQFLARVEGKTPTFVIDAEDGAGAPITDGEVTLDGKRVENALAGRAIATNPGAHTLSVQAREVSVTQTIVLHEHAKGARIVVRTRSAASKQAKADSASIPMASWILGGAGAVALVPSAMFGALGVAQRGADGCDLGCGAESADGVRHKFLLSQIFLGASVVSFAAALVVWAVRGETERTSLKPLSLDGSISF